MTICICSYSVQQTIGGVPVFNRYLTHNLISCGHSVLLLTIDQGAAIDAKDEIQNCGSITTIILKNTYNEKLSKIAPYFRPGGYEGHAWIAMGLSFREWLLKWYKHFKIDIVEIGDYGGAGAFLIDDQLPPLILMGHSSAIQLSRFNYMMPSDHWDVIQKLEKITYQYAQGVISHSPMNVSDISTLFNRNAKFSRAPWISPDLNCLSPAKDFPVIVVGGLQLAKGPQVMIKALDTYFKKDPTFKLHWIGGDTFTAPRCIKVSSFLSSSFKETWNSQFIWHNYFTHKEVFQVLSGCTLAVIPSVWETFNYFALEAAWLKKPLIMTRTTGSSYLFEDDPNTVIVEPDDPGQLSSGIKQLYNREFISSDHFEFLKEYFSPEKIVSERLPIYEEIIQMREPLKNEVSENLQFINKYTTPFRKYYYTTRKWAKFLIKGKQRKNE